MPEQIFIKHAMYIVTYEPISTASFINPFYQSVSVCPDFVARQRLGKIRYDDEYMQQYKNCWTRRFLCGPCIIKGEPVALCMYPSVVVRQRLGKNFTAATKSSWRRRFYAVSVVSKESRRIVLPSTYYYILQYSVSLCVISVYADK
jgi:hypothetical protein